MNKEREALWKAMAEFESLSDATLVRTGLAVRPKGVSEVTIINKPTTIISTSQAAEKKRLVEKRKQRLVGNSSQKFSK